MSKLVRNEDRDTWQLKGVRGSYLHLFKPWAQNEDQEKKYSGRFLIDKKEFAAELKVLQAHFAKLQQDAFKGKIPADKLCIRDGDLTGKSEDEGCFYLQASEKTRPSVVNKDRSPVTEEDDIVYSGCYVNVLVRFWVQNNKYGKRINANLLAVQFVRDGERFGGAGRENVEDHFEDEGFDGADEGDGDGF